MLKLSDPRNFRRTAGGLALILGGFGTIGLTLLRQSDEEWERPGLGSGAAGTSGPAPPAQAPSP